MFSGIGSNSAAKDNEFGFLSGEPTSSVPVTESKSNDPFGNSDPFAASDSKGTNDIFGGISQPKKAAEPDPFGNAFGDSLNLGGSSKPKSKDPFGGWDNDDPVINTQKNDPFGGGSSSSKPKTTADPFGSIMGNTSSSTTQNKDPFSMNQPMFGGGGNNSSNQNDPFASVSNTNTNNNFGSSTNNSNDPFASISP